VPLDAVVEFKRDVYQQALAELSRYVFRPSRRFSAGHRARRGGSEAIATQAAERDDSGPTTPAS